MFFLELEKERHAKHVKAAAATYPDNMPPRISAKIAEMMQAPLYQSCHSDPVVLGDDVVKVDYFTRSGARTVSVSAIVDYKKVLQWGGLVLTQHPHNSQPSTPTPIPTPTPTPTCPGLGHGSLYVWFSARERFPLPSHALRHQDWSSTYDQLLHVHDQLATWRKQYDGVGEFRVPGTDSLYDSEPAPNLVKPVGLPAPKGAPCCTAKRAASRRVDDYLKNKHKKQRLEAQQQQQQQQRLATQQEHIIPTPVMHGK